ncbi:MAG: hypothetical protein ACFFD2_02610 [Promethearchaeota archaeon]
MKKIIVVVLFITFFLSSTMIVIEIYSYFVANKSTYKEESVDFLVDFLWDQDHGGFYSSRFNNESFPERGLHKYTSFNIWATRALLYYSIFQKDNSTFENYGLKALNFIFTYLYNSTNKGIYHWVLQNGSLPDMSDERFNNSIYQIGTYQAWVLITLLEAYEYTGNMTYLNVWGKNLADFLIINLRDSSNGGFYERFLPYFDLIPDTKKYTWYQAWPTLALMNYYEITGNETMLYYANLTLEFMINYLWNTELGCFIDYCLENGTLTPDSQVNLYDQAAALLTISKVIDITKDQTYLTEYLVPILNFTHKWLWSGEFKQFYAGCDTNKTNLDPTLRPSDLSLWLFALKRFIDVLNNSEIFDVEFSRNLLSQSISHMNKVAWDYTSKGFYRKIYLNGTLIETEKWTIEQALPIFLFFQYFPESHFNYFLFSVYLCILISTIILMVYISFKPKKRRKLKRKLLSKT